MYIFVFSTHIYKYNVAIRSQILIQLAEPDCE